MRCLVFALLLTLASSMHTRAQAPAAVEGDSWFQIVQHLAGYKLQGRAPGQPGHDRARDYLIQQMTTHMALQPAFLVGGLPAHQQPIELRTGIQPIGETLALGDAVLGFGPTRDATVLGMASPGRFDAPAVLVGYGIQNESQEYDSLAGVPSRELRDKVWVVFRYEPLNEQGHSRWTNAAQRFTNYAALAVKAAQAQQSGAAALLIVNPPALNNGNNLRTTSGTISRSFNATLPVFHVRTDALAAALGEQGMQRLADWQAQADAGELVPTELPFTVAGSLASLQPIEVKAHNLGFILPGQGDLAEEYVLVGAHYDHIGLGRFGSRAQAVGEIHPGADDNASGTAGVVEIYRRLSQRFAQSPDAPRRSIVFLFFTAEERGLIGSRYMAEHPDELAFDLDRVAGMVNMDMIGNLRDDDLQLLGQTPRSLRRVLDAAAETHGLSWRRLQGMDARSDHAPFAEQGVPAITLHTGITPDYHTPRDTPDTVDPQGADRVLSFATDVVQDLATDE